MVVSCEQAFKYPPGGWGALSPVGEVFPVVEGEAAVDVNDEQAACGVGFMAAGEAPGGGLQFAEPAAQLDWHPARQGGDELDDFEVEQQPVAHSASSSG